MEFKLNSFYKKKIQQLHPIKHHEQIVSLMTYDFFTESGVSYDLGFLKSFAIPRISKLLYKTKEIERHTQKRYDDTHIILSQILINGYSSKVGGDFLKKMNRAHQSFSIPNEDYLYILSVHTFIYIDWLELYGRRSLSANEKLAWFLFWRQLGQHMGIQNIPPDEKSFRSFVIQYEREHMHYSHENEFLMNRYLETSCARRGRLLKPFLKWLTICALDQSYYPALGIKPPKLQALFHLVCLARSCFSKIFFFRLTKNFEDVKFKSYPQKFNKDQVGPSYISG